MDYGTLVDQVRSAVANDPVDLIETLAQRIADVCLRHTQVSDVEVTVHKPEAPLDVAFEDVSVTIHRVADAAAGHGGAPASSQAAWAAQAEAPAAWDISLFSSSCTDVAANRQLDARGKALVNRLPRELAERVADGVRAGVFVAGTAGSRERGGGKSPRRTAARVSSAVAPSNGGWPTSIS